MRFEFATATRIVFGSGAVAEIGALAAEFGRTALLVTGRDIMRAAPVAEPLLAQGVVPIPFAVEGEPTVDTVLAGVEAAQMPLCDMVIACGGGSAIDAGKAIAALLANGGDPLDYLEIVGQGQPLTHPSLPYIAVPTTAGTGAEVTRNAVLSVPGYGVKVSMRSPYLFPRIALIDPELTLGLPPKPTAFTGMDALTQLIEPFVSNRANFLTDRFCREGLPSVARSLPRVYKAGEDLAAREEMALAALYSGFALTNARLGAVHGIAAALGGAISIPHGAACAALLPHVMAVNMRTLQERAPESDALARYDEIGRLLTGDVSATAADGIAWVESLCSEFTIPTLRTYDLTPDAFPQLIYYAARSGSMQGNPIPLTEGELEEILTRAL